MSTHTPLLPLLDALPSHYLPPVYLPPSHPVTTPPFAHRPTNGPPMPWPGVGGGRWGVEGEAMYSRCADLQRLVSDGGRRWFCLLVSEVRGRRVRRVSGAAQFSRSVVYAVRLMTMHWPTFVAQLESACYTMVRQSGNGPACAWSRNLGVPKLAHGAKNNCCVRV